MLPAIIAGASLLGPLLGKAAGGASSERNNQNDYQLRQNQQAQGAHQFDQSALLQALRMNEDGQMNRAQLGISAPRDRAKQALLGSLLKNAQSTKITAPAGVRMGQVSGGMDISSLLKDAREAGGELNTQATAALRDKSDIPAFTDATSRLTASPTPAGYKGAGLLESILSGGGTVASLIGAIAQMKKPNEMDGVSRAGFGV